jgi:hypothetical protein
MSQRRRDPVVTGMTDNDSPQHTTHIYVLLDRSGSMEAIRGDVIGGFNTFLDEQQADGPDARLTLVQFDSQDPAEVLADGVPIREALPLTTATFVPRGGTPLLDATGRLLLRADARAAGIASVGLPPEDVVFTTITDGAENQSREFRRDMIRRMIREREDAGWTFVYLSADVGAYADAGALGYDSRSVQAFAADAPGSRMALASLSAATLSRRASRRRGRSVDTRDFFEGHKPAEATREEGSRSVFPSNISRRSRRSTRRRARS